MQVKGVSCDLLERALKRITDKQIILPKWIDGEEAM